MRYSVCASVKVFVEHELDGNMNWPCWDLEAIFLAHKQQDVEIKSRGRANQELQEGLCVCIIYMYGKISCKVFAK